VLQWQEHAQRWSPKPQSTIIIIMSNVTPNVGEKEI
jgi:hypothetical protein